MKRAPMSVRVSPYIVSLIDWEHPYEDPLRIAVLPARLAPPADHPKLGLDSLARAGRRARARAHAPLPRQGALSAARHVPGLLPLLHALLRHRARHRRGREGAPAPERRALEARVPVHRVAPRARGHRHQRRRRVPAPRPAHRGDRRGAPRDPERAAHALRDQGAGRHADEDPHRRRVGRRADARRREGAASCTRTSCSTRTSTTRTRSPASPRRRWAGSSSAASSCATRACSCAA